MIRPFMLLTCSPILCHFVFVLEVDINAMAIEQTYLELKMWRHTCVHRGTHLSLQQLYEGDILNHDIALKVLCKE